MPTPEPESVAQHDIAVYTKFTGDGVAPRPIVWYIGSEGTKIWQVTENFEGTDSVACKFGRTSQKGRVTSAPQGGVVVGRNNYVMAEHWLTVVVNKRVTLFNLTQALKGVRGPQDYVYSFNNVGVQVAPRVTLGFITQHTYTRGAGPSNEFGIGGEVRLPHGLYVPVQTRHVVGGRPKTFIGFGWRGHF